MIVCAGNLVAVPNTRTISDALHTWPQLRSRPPYEGVDEPEQVTSVPSIPLTSVVP